VNCVRSSLQECVTLIQTLCAEQGVESEDTDKLIKKLASAVTDTCSEREVRSDVMRMSFVNDDLLILLLFLN